MSSKFIKVIETTVIKEDERVVLQYWSKEGNFLAEYDPDAKQIQVEYQTQEKVIQDLNKKLLAFQDLVDSLRAEIKKLKKDVDNSNIKELETCRCKLTRAQMELSKHKNKIIEVEDIEERNENLKRILFQLRFDLNERDEKIIELKQEIKKDKKIIKNLERRVVRLNKKKKKEEGTKNDHTKTNAKETQKL